MAHGAARAPQAWVEASPLQTALALPHSTPCKTSRVRNGSLNLRISGPQEEGRIRGAPGGGGLPKFQPCSQPHVSSLPQEGIRGVLGTVLAAAYGQIRRRNQHKGSFVEVLA